VQLEGSGQLKKPMTSSGIETATFQLVDENTNKIHSTQLSSFQSDNFKSLLLFKGKK
jgi:hypothetical protein